MALAKWISFAQQPAQQSDPPLKKPVPIPCTADGKQFGLENFGNTCYANSVLQALYFCSPFRDLVIQHIDPFAFSSHVSPGTPVRRKPEPKPPQDLPPPNSPPPNAVSHPPPLPVPRTLFSALRTLYIHISQNPADKGTIAPRAFIEKLRELNEAFRNTMHQDAHEFLNYLLNRIVEDIEEEKKQRLASGDDLPRSMNSSSTASHPPVMSASTSSASTPPPGATFIHRIFEGTLTSETRCLTCENLSSRDESFLDLSIDIEQNSSVTACLRQFSASEMLCQKEKFFCDACCDLQEAERRMKIKRLPNVLALHLKRFKYQEDVQKYIKLTYRVAFPLELRLFNTVDDIPNPDRLYELFAIVVHIGNGPNHGHYVSIIKTMGTWLVFDDETVDTIRECDIPKYFGDSNSGSAYVLYYQAVDIDLSALGLQSLSPEPTARPASQSEPSQPVQPTDSPLSTGQLIPPLPPGLSDDVTSPIASVPEALPRPVTPPAPQSAPDSSKKSPRRTPSTLFSFGLRPATVGPAHVRNDPLLRSARSGLDEKLNTTPKPILSPIVISPKDDTKPLETPPPAPVNGKEGNSDRSMLGWLRRRSMKAIRPRPSSEANSDIPAIPQDFLAAPGSPVRIQSTGSSSNSSKDSRPLPDSPNTGRASPRVPSLSSGRLPSRSRGDDASPSGMHSRQSSASGVAHTSPISPTSDQRSQIRPLPVIPASPQTPQSETPSPLTRTSVGRDRTQRRPGVSSAKDYSQPESPKTSGRPATSAGSPTKTRSHGSPLSTPSTYKSQAPTPNTATRRSESKKDATAGRPKSAHATYGAILSSPTSPVPPLPVSATGMREHAKRKLSLSSPKLGFGWRDKGKQ